MLAGSRILAVDDNPVNLAIVEEIFQGRCKLHLADDGAEALQIAPSFLPDVVLLDVMMPRPDGYEVCSRLKNDRTLRQSQVIMISANTDIEARLRGYHAGADDYISRPFDESELCAKVAANLRTKSLHSATRRQLESLSSVTGEVLEMVAHLRDAETGEHLDRIRIYSRLLAAELRQGAYRDQIDEAFLDDLDRASPLHDIGKVSIPDAILHKPGPLTADERKMMQRHAVVGEQILGRLAMRDPDVRHFEMAAEIALWHHESFDGTGYPDGLRGQEIPLAARIVKVADVFDALTSARVYKSKMPPEAARDQMIRVEAPQFDPLILDAMLRVFDDFVAVCVSYDSSEAVPHATAVNITK